MRIDLVHDRLPRLPRALLNLVAAIFLALSAISLVAMAGYSLNDSISMSSTAQTPWATPLKYPQSIWLAVLVVFVLVALGYALRAIWLATTGRMEQLDEEYQPKSTKDELKEELEDIKARGALESAGVPVAGEAP